MKQPVIVEFYDVLWKFKGNSMGLEDETPFLFASNGLCSWVFLVVLGRVYAFFSPERYMKIEGHTPLPTTLPQGNKALLRDYSGAMMVNNPP